MWHFIQVCAAQFQDNNNNNTFKRYVDCPFFTVTASKSPLTAALIAATMKSPGYYQGILSHEPNSSPLFFALQVNNLKQTDLIDTETQKNQSSVKK